MENVNHALVSTQTYTKEELTRLVYL